ncbi:MAG: tail protein (tape measure) [Rouxiella badensis]|uniref:tail protein (tape measure) n=1 Tax=Rouxiella badensis TaxID=1646377 RepID=UPI003C53AD81
MSDKQNAGSIYYDVELETAQLLTGAKQVDATLDGMSSSAASTGKALDNLGKNTKSAASSLNQMTGYAKSMDGSIQTLNTNVSAMAIAIQQANTSSSAASLTLSQMGGAMNTLLGAVKSIADAMKAASASTAAAGTEFSRAEAMIEGLGNQIAILDEAQENGARSAAILAAQLRLGASASDAEKQKVGELTGQLFDMKTTTDTGSKSHVNWKNSMQQAGYQVQDFIVQVQGGQSALVAFSQQGSQLAGAFGPSGAVFGAIIALGTVIVGTLIKAMGDAEDTMKDLATATNALDQVVNISQSGVAALSDKYALLARTNAEAATILRNQALIEYNQAISKIPAAVTSASNSIISFGDAVLSGLGGGYASIQNFGSALEALSIKTGDYGQAVSQAQAAGTAFSATTNGMINTVGAIASQFGISQQQAYSLALQLDNVAKTKSPEALQALVLQLQSMKSSTDDGQAAITTFVGKLVDLVRESANAKANISALKGEMDNLTAGQKNLITQSQRELALSKLQGAARARLQALYKAEDAGFSGDSPQAKQLQSEAEASYNNAQAIRDQKKAKNDAASAAKRLANEQQNVVQKLQSMTQQSQAAQDSAADLVASYDSLKAGLASYNRELAIQKAARSLGKGATAQQIQEAKQFAAAQYDAEQKVKDLKDAIAADPVRQENTSFNDTTAQLSRQLSAGIITQQEYNTRSEKLAQQHKAKLAEISAEQVVSPTQQAVAQVDPIQQLANENAQKLALIKQFMAQKVLTEQQGLLLMNAANTQYEQQRVAAQWALFTQQSTGYQALGAAVDAFGSSAGSALSGVITGTESASEAARNLANTILSSVIQTFVDMGIQQAKSAIMGASTQQAAIAATTTAQVSGLATTTAASTAAAGTTLASWLPAALVASVGSFGAAAIVGGAALASAFALSKVLGGRKNGGPVTGGGMYQVGESGLPEIYQASNGSQYMIPGDNGRVLSNKDLQGGSGVSVQINITNTSSGAQVSQQGYSDQNGQAVIELLVSDLEKGGQVSNTIQSTFGLNRRANGDY